ncbi:MULTISPECIES: TadA family conjugal transfer-associated ATPase [unclassified Frigoribacterium]|uniref:TadA family conjugal transfer-associated ATPase n=1 Tax=unclassified Frigoribacterium TaxID=2627005 RepID=UPI0015637B08|nr:MULTISPECIES: TadA family conjugal transfer-associated ATPase [unclassified Frigoribacterium]NQW86571.1 TadA family conjugal transfer-associated ATPase [Frigoribacterium sp. VKM Ac-2860]NQX07902.1 TadA family conjugal transfer-associated ATPase [Frigoribacterium sp. VKM Ac-2859]
MSHAPQVDTADHPSLTLRHPPSRFALPPVPALGLDRGTDARFGVQGRLARPERSAFGPLGRLLDDPAVTDVFVTGGVGVWVDRGDGAEPETSIHLSEASARQVAVRLVSLGGRHVDESSPCVDVRLGDGLRVHVVLPPLAVAGTALSIRVPRVESMSLLDLDRRGFFPAGALEAVIGCVERRANVLVSGSGGAGKTTFLAALLSEAPVSDRIVTIEDVAELRPRHPHVVALETRQPNLEGAGGVDLSRLVREALRMRPDRLVVGEVRGPEIRDLLSALNTGHDGGAGTVHANGLDDVPARLEALGALAGLGVDALARQAVSAIDAVFHLERRDGRRRLAEIGHLAVTPEGRLVARTGSRG